VNPAGEWKNSICQVSCRATHRPVPIPGWRDEVSACGVVEAVSAVDDFADEATLGAPDPDLLDAPTVLDCVPRDLGGG
jgi:hypothetical protein